MPSGHRLRTVRGLAPVASFLLDVGVGQVAMQRRGRVDLSAASGHVVPGLPLTHQFLCR
jgi:hypothetical protein